MPLSNLHTSPQNNQFDIIMEIESNTNNYIAKPAEVITEAKAWKGEIVPISLIRQSLPLSMWHSAGISRSQEII